MRLLIIAVFLATMLLLAALFILTDRALSVPASPPPASAEWVGWAKRWHGQAVRARRAYARVRRCQGRAAPRPIAALPASTDFYVRDAAERDGLSRTCKECRNRRGRERYAERVCPSELRA